MRDTFASYAAGDKSIGMNTRYVRVEAAADKYGDEYCRKAIDKYLYDESDTRTPDEFIDDLNRGTENIKNWQDNFFVKAYKVQYKNLFKDTKCDF